ncbi:MAG: exosortase/archaeosortase family protein [Phycisphaerae bacterium]|nr:exosortase/archaeosortase family protein [Phycisphaerae bacterium]
MAAQMKDDHNLICESSQTGTDCKCDKKHFSCQGTAFSGDGTSVRSSWNELPVHSYVKIAIIGGLFVYLFYGEIESIVGQWITDSSWSHGFLIPLFSLYFIDQAKGEILNLRPRPNYLGLLFMILGILFYFFNVVSPSGYGYFRPTSMIAILGAIVLFLGGWGLIKYTWLPITYLVFAVPLPTRYYFSLTMPMQRLAAQVTAFLLNIVSGMRAEVNGVVISGEYLGQKLDPPLNVAEACSGMRLLMAFLALGVAMAYLHYRPVWQRIVLLASTIPIAIFCNIVRVTTTGFIYIMVNPKYAQGIYHDMLGLAMLPLAFGLYGLLAWFMSSLFVEQDESITEDVVIRRQK